MKDLELFQTVFTVLKFILGAICLGLMVFGLFSGVENGVLMVLPIAIVWGLCHLILRLNEILYTRFIAMTENVLEVTTILEKKFKEE